MKTKAIDVSPEVAAELLDVLENFIIATDMGWDLEGIRESAVAACVKAGSVIFESGKEDEI